MSDEISPGLKRLREPFPANQIGKLPKPTKAQTDAVRADFKAGARCNLCGAWHHPQVVHLDYVGHAALTDRLLDADPGWSWEPLAYGPDGLPLLDADGGLWIRLTVCGIARLGYGDAQGKTGGDAVKERIGDALRNGAMRFGAALDLWHKGDLHAADDDVDAPVALISKDQALTIHAKLTDNGIQVAPFVIWIQRAMKCQSIETIPEKSYATVLAALDAKIKAKGVA